MMHPTRFVSLWEMLELNAAYFLEAVTELNRLNVVLANSLTGEIGDQDSYPGTRQALLQSIAKVKDAINAIGARCAGVAAEKMQSRLLDSQRHYPMNELHANLKDIEGRFADEVGFIRLFVISNDRVILFESADKLLGSQTASRFPSIWFECEEAAKCLCLGRSTASVFHVMRMLEIGIRALGKRLGLPDPVSSNERNWGTMLKAISLKLAELYPVGKRLPNTDGAHFEKIYVSLDAIKNPWRNATMHVEHVYTEEEARHILTCTSKLFEIMSASFDESGLPVDDPSLSLLEQP